MDPSSNRILLASAAAGSKDSSFWILRLNNDQATLMSPLANNANFSTDAADNIYAIGGISYEGGNSCRVVKVSTQGVVQSSPFVPVFSTGYNNHSCSLLSDGTYVYNYPTAANSANRVATHLSAANSILTTFTHSVYSSNIGKRYIKDLQGNIWVNTQAGVLLKFDSSWNLLQSWSVSNLQDFGISSDGNLILYTQKTYTTTGPSFTSYGLRLTSVTPTMSINWSRFLVPSQLNASFGVQNFRIGQDGSIYCSGSTSGGWATGQNHDIFAKFSSNGFLQWAYYPTGIYQNIVTGFDSDKSGNAYVWGRVGGGSTSAFTRIAKFSSGGSLLWRNYFADGYGATRPGSYSYSLAINKYGTPIVTGIIGSYSGQPSGWSNPFMAKLPPDGLGTGTYTSFQYNVDTSSNPFTGFSSFIANADAGPTIETFTVTKAAATPQLQFSTPTRTEFYPL